MILRGMFEDSMDRANQPEGTWTSNTRNIVITKDSKAVSNENGFTVYSNNYPSDLFPIGYVTLYNDEFAIMSVNADNTVSDIGVIDAKGNYRTVLRDPILGFRKDRLITGTKQKNIFEETEIVFTDNHIRLCILNIDKLPFEVDSEYALIDKTLINNLYIFPDLNVPEIQVDSVDMGGAIPTGVVHFTGQYEDFNGALTNTFPLSNPVLILPRTETAYKKIGGGRPNEVTTNAVKLTIGNLDRRFKKLRLIAVRKSGGQYYAEAVRSLPIKGNSLQYTYTGTEGGRQDISLGEVLVDRPSYTTAAGVLSHDDILYPYGLRVKPKVNIQKYVNNWKLKYITDTVSVDTLEGSYKDGKTYFSKRHFMHNEVYAMYGIPVMLDGNYGDAFHIPGRAVRAIAGMGGFMENDLITDIKATYTDFDEDDLVNPGQVRYYQTRDTSSMDGTLGYWENQSEFYPDTDDWDIVGEAGVVGTLRNGKVRHHKMPAIDTHGYLDETFSNANIIGLSLSDVWLPDEIWAQVQRIEIFYAKRTGGNSVLAGRGLLMFAANSKVEGEEDQGIATNGINIDFEARETTETIRLRNDAIRVQAYDMLVDRTSILPNFIYINNMIRSKLWADLVEQGASSQLRMDLTTAQRATIYPTGMSQKIRGINSQKYLPFNTIIDEGLSNRWAEETFFAKLNTPGYIGAMPYLFIDLSAEDREESYNDPSKRHDTFLVDLVVWRDNAYFGYDTQDLVSTGFYIKGNGSLNAIYGGDAYYGTHGYIATAGTPNTFRDPNEHDASRIKISYIVETANPPELQYDEFYPRNDIKIENHTDNFKQFPIQVNKDYTSLNSLNPVTVYDPELREATFLPNRILRSKKSQREERVSSWRIFLPNDYYEVARDRGRIIHIEAMNGELLIQQEFGLFLTRGSDTFHTDATTIEVGSGDVFRMPPREVMDSKEGYIGCQSKLACIKGKSFYFTVDELQGKVFVLDNQLKEISNEGMYHWFREHLMVDNLLYPQPLMMTAFDEVNNRLLMTKRAATIKNYKGRIEEVDLDTLEIGDVVLKEGAFVKVSNIDCPSCDVSIGIVSVEGDVCDVSIETVTITY